MSTIPSTTAKRIAALRSRLARFDFVCTGTLIKRSLVCGKPNCRCKADPPALHGPYYYWSRRLGGRLVQQILSQEQVPMVRQAIANYREALRLLKRWEAETAKIVESRKVPKG